MATYDTEKIVRFMLAVAPDYVDGYNQLDAEGLLQVACTELQTEDETSTPIEFEVACKRVEAWHKER